jgi:hypothetical protein
MSETKQPPDPLVEWDRLNKENHENAGASKMFVAALTRVPTELSNYTSWFTAGVGAVVVLLLSNVDKVAPYLGEATYARAITAFAVAVGLGALSKLLATYVTALIAMQEEINREIQAALQSFDADAKKIRAFAEQRNFDLNTDFNFPGLMEKFHSQLGPTMRLASKWGFTRAMRSKNPILHRFRMPIRLAQAQALCFLLSVAAAIFGVSSAARTVYLKAWGSNMQQPMPKSGRAHAEHVTSAGVSGSP